MIMPVLCTLVLIHISLNYWTNYHSYEIILEWELFIELEFKFMFDAHPLLQKKTFILT